MSSQQLTGQLRSNALLTAIGTYVPEQKLTNSDLEKRVETSDEWIIKRTGIHERRIAKENEYTSDLIYRAIDNMIDRYAITVTDVDYIIVATSTPDTIFPSMAARVQERFNIIHCGTIDIQAACAGFTAGLQLGNALLLTGIYRKVLVVGADVLSKVTDYTDRTTCILFGDGAGAVIMEQSNTSEGSMIASYSDTDGSGGHNVYLNNLSPSIGEHPIETNGKLVQNGREVYRWAISSVADGVQKLLNISGLTVDDINWFIPHNANERIITALSERVGFSGEQTLSSIAHYGNTSAASIPLALDDAVRAGKVKKGHTLLLHGFGGGLTQAGVVLRWTI